MAEYGNRPFKEQIDYFQDKVKLPTASWTDIWEGMHSRAFVVAGAMKEDLVNDFYKSIEKAIADGATIADFRKDFDAIVAKHGWSYSGGRNWRTRVIFDTNLRQSYSAGRELQMKDPELRKRRPYGLYRLGNSENHRDEHVAFDGLVLPLDDTWWEMYTPQNGWGCKCRKFMVSQADVDRMGLKVAEKAPAIVMRTERVGTQGPNPRTVQVPNGIDPGFAYNPGTAAWGKQLSKDVMDGWNKAKAAAWETLTSGDPASYGRPSMIPAFPMPTQLGLKVASVAQLQQAIEDHIGGPSRVYQTPAGAINVNAEFLAGHIHIARARYITLLSDLLMDPYEQWIAFDRHRGTGQVVLRSRTIKLYGKDGMLIVAQARNGQLEAWTVIPSTASYLNKQRRGKLLYGK